MKPVVNETSALRGRPKDELLAAKRKGEILRCAIRHFARHGFRNADLDAIAAELKCAKGTLYHYFETKVDLFSQAVDLVMRELLEATESKKESDDPIENLEFGVRTFLTFFDTHPEYVELIVQERAEFRDRKNPTYFKYRSVSDFRCADSMRQSMASGWFREMPLERALDAIGDRLYGTIFVNHFAGRTKTLEQQATDVLDTLFRGLLTPQAMERWVEKKRREHE
jgi:AcrR family transcriptional regulator